MDQVHCQETQEEGNDEGGEGAEGRKGRSWQRHWAANMMALVARLIDG